MDPLCPLDLVLLLLLLLPRGFLPPRVHLPNLLIPRLRMVVRRVIRLRDINSLRTELLNRVMEGLLLHRRHRLMERPDHILPSNLPMYFLSQCSCY